MLSINKAEEKIMGRITVAAVVTLWVIPISIFVNKIVPHPYMDEIFHIPQAQRYCKGDYKTWDPMITTPPGLYYLSLAYVASMFPGMWFASAVQLLPDLCSTAYLRTTNAFLAIICSILVYDLVVHLRPSSGERKATICAILLALYPVHWFFTFLYYTDVASVTAVLAMYLASLKGQYWFSAMFGALATFFRQTNIVWMVFVAADGAIRFVEFYQNDRLRWGENKPKLEEESVQNNINSIPTAPTLRKRRMDSSTSTPKPYNSEMTQNTCHASSGFINEVLDIALTLWYLKWKVFVSFAPYLIVLVAFITFVAWNGSIVLGAKEAHTVSPHFAQMLYFALFSAGALTPFHFSFGQVSTLLQMFWKNKLLHSFQVLIALFIGFVMVQLFRSPLVEIFWLMAQNGI